VRKGIEVLHIITSLGQGGAERQLVELVKENKNHAICQLVSGNFYKEELDENKTIRFNLKLKKNIFDIIALYKLYKILIKYKPSIIHAWMYHSCLLAVLLKVFSFKRDISLVWGLRCSNMDTSQYSFSLKLVIKVCKYFSHVPDIIIYNSHAGLGFHESIGFKNKNIVIYNGIDISKFSSNNTLRINFRNKFKIDQTAKVLLCVGRRDPMKDHNNLFKAFEKIKKKYPSITLILAGSGTENIKSNGIIALGARQDINQVYAASDIIISSSAFGEGFSNALAEGMASSLLPIATNVGDSKHILGDIGKIIEPGNNKKLYEAIKETIELDEETFYNKRILSKKRISNNFSKLKMLKSYQKLYNKFLKG
jgi:glycosyltransferase involved in cell wall biosynthesis